MIIHIVLIHQWFQNQAADGEIDVCFDQSLKIFQKDIARTNGVRQRLRGSYLRATILRIAWMLTEAA